MVIMEGARTLAPESEMTRLPPILLKVMARLDGLQPHLPLEPMIVGAVGAARFALDRAPAKAARDRPNAADRQGELP